MNSVQCKMARAAKGWGVRELAKKAGVSIDTISRLERGDELLPRTITAIRTALETSGIRFVSEGEVAVGDGVVLKAGYDQI